LNEKKKAVDAEQPCSCNLGAAANNMKEKKKIVENNLAAAA
jgi:hypothetical protein